jgi:ABC-type lipoprotein export system ATPase subunit
MNKIDINNIKSESLRDLHSRFPFIASFFENQSLEIDLNSETTLLRYFEALDEEEKEEKAIDSERLIDELIRYINQMFSFIGTDSKTINALTIEPGFDKKGNAESIEPIVIHKGEVISIVGPTGSGKSRLLADIEWVAQKDTPTGRRILINNETPEKKWRFSSSDKLVAQLSQNMNFVMDLTVYEFIELHAESRLINDKEKVIDKIIAKANDLAGEKFDHNTAITSLSGGQSRALMIADTAILSRSPIILIDEIENAGINRKQALKILLDEDKIVLMATHDPILALMANKRLVIKNGAIDKVIETTDEERNLLDELEKLDNKIQSYRQELRNGYQLSVI